MRSQSSSGSLMAASLLPALFYSLFLLVRCARGGIPAGLQLGYYKRSCPEAEDVVRHVIADRAQSDPTIIPALIRLHFHDCFVRGCDASILLDETRSGKSVEKDSGANKGTLNNNSLNAIDFAKTVLETSCPGTVSCADILAFTAREAVELAGLRRYDVPSGRKDGNVSDAYEAQMPGPGFNVKQLTDMFAKKGISQNEMVVLSGAHSIGRVRCDFVKNSLYSFADGQPQDPSLEPAYANFLKGQCPAPGTFAEKFLSTDMVNFGLNASKANVLDNSYYQNLKQGRGLLGSDRALMTDRKTRTVVERMANDNPRWAKKFIEAFIKVGALDVLIGDQGNVRKQCRFLN